MNIGIIGLGTVTQGFLEILRKKSEWVQNEFGATVKVVAIKDLLKGDMYNPSGIDLNLLFEKLKARQSITDGSLSGKQSISSLEDVDIVVEATYSDYESGNPAYKYIKTALKKGKHVVTTNKGPIALHFSELNKLAERNSVLLRYEGTVLSGTPVFSFFEECLRGDDVMEVRGILNGTSNYILSEMAKGSPFQDALTIAQEKGYAEADPTNDVAGFDARGKVAILAHYLFQTDLGLQNIPTTGIDSVSEQLLKAAKRQQKNIRLIGHLKKSATTIEASVKPVALPEADSLSTVDGVTNALEVTTRNLGKVLITGPGAGRLETGYAVFSDVLSIIKNNKQL